MVHFLAISIFLLPIVTASGDDYWDYVDMIRNDVSDSAILPIQATTSEEHVVQPTSDIPQHSTAVGERDENPRKRRGPSTEKFFPKFVTLHPVDIATFRQLSIINESSTQNISHTLMMNKLLALGRTHNWNQLRTYQVDKYSKYWANVCVIFWGKKLDQAHRVACVVSRNYINNMRRKFEINQEKHYLDLLSCRCHTYLTYYKIPLSAPETFLIHKGNENEFFKFEDNETEGQLSLTGYEEGIALADPREFERTTSSRAKFHIKKVTLGSTEIKNFTRAIHINNPYLQNASLEELEKKLMELEEIHEWPDLFKYDYEVYSRYWAKVCIYFWGKTLNSSHRQGCLIYPSLGDSKIRKLFIQNKPKHYDLLYCKCHSYITNYRIPISNADTFLIHQSSDNEFFVFEQQATLRCQFTLFIKDFKGGISLPNPDDFN